MSLTIIEVTDKRLCRFLLTLDKIVLDHEYYDTFKRILKNRMKLKVEPSVDGINGFLFFDKNNKPLVTLHWEKYM